MAPLPTMMYNSELENSQLPQMRIYYSTAFVFNEQLSTNMCFACLKRWQGRLAGKHVCWPRGHLTLSFRCFSSWYVIHRSPSLLYATLYEPTNWTLPKSLAPWVMMPVTLVGTRKSTWKRRTNQFSTTERWITWISVNVDHTWTYVYEYSVQKHCDTAHIRTQFESRSISYSQWSVIIIKQQVISSFHKIEITEIAIIQ